MKKPFKKNVIDVPHVRHVIDHPKTIPASTIPRNDSNSVLTL